MPIKEHKPYITFIIPTYNSSSYIGETLSSIIDASRGLFYEVLIVDDCSDDIPYLKKAVAHYPRTRIIIKDQKSNASHSRAIGAALSRTPLIHFLDSDDELIANTLQRKIDLINKTGADFIISNFFEGHNKVINNFPSGILISGNGRDFLFSQGNDVRSSTILIRKESFRDFTFDPTLRKHQDWGFFIAALDRGLTFAFYDECSVRMNIERDGRMSNKINVNASRDFLDKYNLNETQKSNFALRHIKSAIRNRDIEAFEYYSSLLSLSGSGAKPALIKLASHRLLKHLTYMGLCAIYGK